MRSKKVSINAFLTPECEYAWDEFASNSFTNAKYDPLQCDVMRTLYNWQIYLVKYQNVVLKNSVKYEKEFDKVTIKPNCQNLDKLLYTWQGMRICHKLKYYCQQILNTKEQKPELAESCFKCFHWFTSMV